MGEGMFVLFIEIHFMYFVYEYVYVAILSNCQTMLIL